MNLPVRLGGVSMQKGLTVIEILIVIAIVAIIGASVAPFLSRFILANSLETTKNELVGTLRKAQENSLNEKAGSVWGVCFVSNNIRLYSGTCAVPSYSEDFTKPSVISLSGLQDTTFSNLTGEPSNQLSISLSTQIDSTLIEMNEIGGLDITEFITSPTPTTTPTPTPSSCSQYCQDSGYAGGICRANSNQCTGGEVYEPAGDQYCPGGGGDDTCCCQ